MSEGERKPLPMTEWLSVMLGEVKRKNTEAGAAEDERTRRAATAAEEPAPTKSRDQGP